MRQWAHLEPGVQRNKGMLKTCETVLLEGSNCHEGRGRQHGGRGGKVVVTSGVGKSCKGGGSGTGCSVGGAADRLILKEIIVFIEYNITGDIDTTRRDMETSVAFVLEAVS